MPSKILQKHADLGLLILRLGFGLGFIYFHGWSKLTAGPEQWAGYGAVMERIGIGFGHTFFGFMAALVESVGGLLIAAGLFFRPVTLLLAFTMLMASISHFASGRGTPAHAFKNLWVVLGLFYIGPGRYSLDAWIAGRRGKTREEDPGVQHTGGSQQVGEDRSAR